MKAKKTYAVFGLGRYGTAVARELVENGMEVIAVDTEERIVNDAAVYLPVCKCADVTDAEVISRLGIGNIDTVINKLSRYGCAVSSKSKNCICFICFHNILLYPILISSVGSEITF